jgi:hypothetical protein
VTDSARRRRTVNPVNDQEALGQSIVEQALNEQSRLDLLAANDRAASSFEGQYQHATAGPEYDPTEADPYGFQQILGRAIVQQSQPTPQILVDDSPLNRLGSGDVASWATAAANSLKDFVTTPAKPGTVSNVPKQIFSNRPGQGGGYVITPGRLTASAAPSAGAPSFLILGLIGVGVYLALK